MLRSRRPLLSQLLRFAVPTWLCILFLFFCKPLLLHKQPDLFVTTSSKTSQAPASPLIPEKFWYKIGYKGVNETVKGWIDTCLNNNPTFEHEFMTDASGDDFVREHFAHRPDLVEMFFSLRIPIVKADLLRYMILYEKGGTWNDLDVTCEDVPIRDWIPAEYRQHTGLVVGLEFDSDEFARQFTSWTIQSKPKSPHMLMVIEDCIQAVRNKTEELNIGAADLRMDMIGDVVDFSGPRRMTNAILKSLSLTLDCYMGQENVTFLSEPRLFGDVLVFPDSSFSNKINHEFGDCDDGRRLVTHHYAGSWKNDHGSEEFDDGSHVG